MILNFEIRSTIFVHVIGLPNKCDYEQEGKPIFGKPEENPPGRICGEVRITRRFEKGV